MLRRKRIIMWDGRRGRIESYMQNKRIGVKVRKTRNGRDEVILMHLKAEGIGGLGRNGKEKKYGVYL